MNWLDIVIIVAFAISALFGFWQGLIRAIFSLVGIIVGVIVASNFYQDLASLMGFISNPNIADIVAFIVILLAVIVVSAIIAVILRTILQAIRLGWIDRIAGAVLGFIFGVLLFSAILAGFVKFFGQGLVTDSVIAGILLDKFPIILGLLPGDFKVVRDFFQ